MTLRHWIPWAVMVAVHVPFAFGGGLWANSNFGFWVLPLFGAYLADGYRYTRSPLTYFTRLLVWGAISQPLYQWYFGFYSLNALWALAGALAAYHFLRVDRRPLGAIDWEGVFKLSYAVYPLHLAVLQGVKVMLD